MSALRIISNVLNPLKIFFDFGHFAANASFLAIMIRLKNFTVNFSYDQRLKFVKFCGKRLNVFAV